MAWGRKAEQIFQLMEDRRQVVARALKAESAVLLAHAERDVARIDAKAFKRKADDLERVARERREALTDREQEIRVLKDRQRELEWAVQLLNVACGRTGDDMSSPLIDVQPSELEAAREAVRERDIVVKWDDLTGKPEVHFPKKDERRAPWAQGAMHIGFSAADLIYDPSRSSVGLFSPIENPA